MTRAAVRSGIAAYFGGATFDPAYRIWRPTPLAAAGLAGVRAFFPKRMSDDDYTFGYSPPRGMGGVMIVHLPTQNRTRIAIGGLHGGIKNERFSAELHLYHLGQVPHVEDAQADFDALVEAIIARLEADPTLGGIVTQAGEGDAGITVAASEPYVKGERVESYGVIRFDANDYPTA